MDPSEPVCRGAASRHAPALSYNMLAILHQAAEAFATVFDIDIRLVTSRLERPAFLTWFEQAYQQCRRLVRSSSPESSDTSQLALWCREMCGAIIEQHNNGYRKYCNVHKYMHHQDQADHEFVFKDEVQLAEEICFMDHYHRTVEVLTGLRNLVISRLYHQLVDEYDVQRYSPKEVDRVNSTIAANPRCFKAKHAIDGCIWLYVPSEPRPATHGSEGPRGPA